ncbi:hypothetical protein LWF01_17355 [Saxibacter everestensis]|uniref:Uncharacterized protein n=1 Tax=Saxibacter everestensis TaxID=2909229 RepID=A0ABY8QS70_9MICO|nr:hypothetical protein LWF01_17355 [Brevibacteriaceae bacterium ZFBP1038]
MLRTPLGELAIRPTPNELYQQDDHDSHDRDHHQRKAKQNR